MDELLIYTLKVSVCTMLFYGLYALLLRKETHFSFNRFYLLITSGISLILPLLHIQFISGDTDTGFSGLLQTVQVGQDNVISTNNTLLFSNYAFVFYLSGGFFFSMRFILRFVSLILIRRQCSIERRDGFFIALSKKRIAPFSFFGTVFIDRKTIHDGQLHKIIIHETIHIRQLHSLDIIFAEIICILTWFNPVIWIIKAALKETHEYLADSGVSEQTSVSAEYYLLLLRNAIGVQPGLANNFNKSLTLKRLNMMKKNRSGRLSMLKALPALPLVLLLFAVFSCSNSNGDSKSQNSSSQLTEKTDSVIDKMPEFKGGQEAMTKFIIDNVKYPEAAKKNGTQGKVLVNFIVTKTGKLDKIKVQSKVDDLLDAEAVRVVKAMPDWIPGEDKGSKIEVEMTLPINFKLEEK